MDIIKLAEKRRDALKVELANLEDFLTTAYELQGEMFRSSSSKPDISSAAPRSPTIQPRRKAVRKPPKSGVIYDTAMAVKEFMSENSDGVRTRDLLPVVKGKGVEIGGVNEVATLSARLSQSKMFRLAGGEWYILREADEEATDSPTKDTSVASDLNQTKEGTDGTTLI